MNARRRFLSNLGGAAIISFNGFPKLSYAQTRAYYVNMQTVATLGYLHQKPVKLITNSGSKFVMASRIAVQDLANDTITAFANTQRIMTHHGVGDPNNPTTFAAVPTVSSAPPVSQTQAMDEFSIGLINGMIQVNGGMVLGYGVGSSALTPAGVQALQAAGFQVGIFVGGVFFAITAPYALWLSAVGAQVVVVLGGLGAGIFTYPAGNANLLDVNPGILGNEGYGIFVPPTGAAGQVDGAQLETPTSLYDLGGGNTFIVGANISANVGSDTSVPIKALPPNSTGAVPVTIQNGIPDDTPFFLQSSSSGVPLFFDGNFNGGSDSGPEGIHLSEYI